ncbi:MAG: phosphatase PAP2 family protein, partial [Rhodococcus sp.]|nr:phosphatase PAP2 family protein [Rhodococcus sp. (in: high G+C Gram-positive bacteria)]
MSTGVDVEVLDTVVRERTAGVVDAVTVFTQTGGTIAMWIASTIVVAALWWSRRRSAAIYVGAAMLSGWALMNGIKVIVRRERPPIPERLIEINSYSFPSGHAMMTAIFATAVAVVLTNLALPRIVLWTTWVLLGLFTV